MMNRQLSEKDTISIFINLHKKHSHNSSLLINYHPQLMFYNYPHQPIQYVIGTAAAEADAQAYTTKYHRVPSFLQ